MLIPVAAAHLSAVKQDVSNLQAAETIANMLIDECPASAAAYLLKLKIWNSNNEDIKMLQYIYHQAMRCCELTGETLTNALDIIHFVKEHASLRTTLAGIDVLIKRHHSQASIKIDYVDFERIYVVKFHILATVDLGDSGDENEESLMQLIHSSFADILHHRDTLNKNTLAACQLIFWRAGDGQYHQRKYALALRWYLCAEQLCPTKSADKSNLAVLQRKIALCHVELGEYAKAKEAIENARSLDDNAVTFFVAFHISLCEFKDDEGIVNLGRMCDAAGFTIEMLSAAANLCHQVRANKKVLVEVLRLLMNEYTGGRYVQDVEILVILRVLIRLSEDLSKDCNTSTSQVVESVCGYLETAYHVLHNLWSQPEPSSLALSTGRTASLKELEWFAQTAWNFGLQSCEVWKDDTLTNRFLGIAFKLLDLIMPETMDTIHRKKLCLFISIASRMLENCDRDPKIIHIVLEDIKKLKRLKSVATSLSVSVTTDSIVSDPTDGLVLLFEFEANVRLKQYENAVQTIQVADSFKQLSLHIFERMAALPHNGMFFAHRYSVERARLPKHR
ncbi:hypothetical protein BC936DRAFT_148354 [Jimgerdemannia flammicorona]|uniref:Protein ZIP4 homolog n=1 Tax=Jimgerdemannia flammicorona TaxID=994334 RepID=A0A433DN64_9FUNG|nr:hypothetical protein BC936DRAFT_148354 [Jimgerdemannia flammicorona]